ncbi:hypothetical protein BKA69DRAFT_1129815 [Paraphysoderma sedebokerense]|nr:hypothetical protein BKA69DRAFT_1129815 [Paraphysoderma sedebokerense]
MADSKMQDTLEMLCKQVVSLTETVTKLADKVDSIDHRCQSLEESIQEQKLDNIKNLNEFRKELKSDIKGQIDTNTQKIYNKVEEVRKDLKSDIKEQIDNNTQNICNKLEEIRKELKSDITNLYKAVVRPSIAKKYGCRYSEWIEDIIKESKYSLDFEAAQ